MVLVRELGSNCEFMFKLWLVAFGFLVYMHLHSVSLNSLLKYISIIFLCKFIFLLKKLDCQISESIQVIEDFLLAT